MNGRYSLEGKVVHAAQTNLNDKHGTAANKNENLQQFCSSRKLFHLLESVLNSVLILCTLFNASDIEIRSLKYIHKSSIMNYNAEKEAVT